MKRVYDRLGPPDVLPLIFADYMREYKLPIYSALNRKKFVTFSCVHWACEELLSFMTDNYDILDCFDAISRFRTKMYACKLVSEKKLLIFPERQNKCLIGGHDVFVTALDVIDDIEDIFCDWLMKGENGYEQYS